MENFETLWAYCQINQRAIPKDWNKLWGLLKNKVQIGNRWEPPLPLILAAWFESTPIEKHNRFREHIEWAVKQNQIEEISIYLISLDESEWLHFGEI